MHRLEAVVKSVISLPGQDCNKVLIEHETTNPGLIRTTQFVPSRCKLIPGASVDIVSEIAFTPYNCPLIIGIYAEAYCSQCFGCDAKAS